MDHILWIAYLCALSTVSIEGAPSLTSFAFVQDIGYLELTFSVPLNVPVAVSAVTLGDNVNTIHQLTSAVATVTDVYVFLKIGGMDLTYLMSNTTPDLRYINLTSSFGSSGPDNIRNFPATWVNATSYSRNVTEVPLEILDFDADFRSGHLTLDFSKPVMLSSLSSAQLQYNATLDNSTFPPIPTIPIAVQSLRHTDDSYTTVDITLPSHDLVELNTSPILGANTSTLYFSLGGISDYENNTLSSTVTRVNSISRPCYNKYNNVTLGICECDTGCLDGCTGPTNVQGWWGCFACKLAVQFRTTNECLALNCTDLKNATCIKCIDVNGTLVNATQYCVPKCPLNTFASNGFCLPCDRLCKGCVGYAENCTDCAFSYVEAYPNVTCGLPCRLGFTYNTNTSNCELTDEFRYIVIPTTCGGGGLLVIIWATVYFCCCCFCRNRKFRENKKGMVKIDKAKERVALEY
eukprot:Em0012g79a